jgi:hypothetical protein
VGGFLFVYFLSLAAGAAGLHYGVRGFRRDWKRRSREPAGDVLELAEDRPPKSLFFWSCVIAISLLPWLCLPGALDWLKNPFGFAR